MAFKIKRNDTSPTIARTLKNASGNTIDLTGATVRFHMADSVTGTIKVDADATVVSTAGQVKYDWLAADTDTAGLFNSEWEVTYSDGSIETVPNQSYEEINIYADLA